MLHASLAYLQPLISNVAEAEDEYRTHEELLECIETGDESGTKDAITRHMRRLQIEKDIRPRA